MTHVIQDTMPYRPLCLGLLSLLAGRIFKVTLLFRSNPLD